MKRFYQKVVSILLILGLFAVAGCGGDTAGNDSQNQGANNQKPKIVAGTNATFPPFESMENEELVGFDMDLIRAIGEAQGYEVEIQHMEFKSLIPALQTDKIDVAIAGMSIDEERKQAIDFSTPYFDAGLIIAVNKDNTQNITDRESLKGKKLAAQIGTTGANACAEIQKADPSTELRTFKDVGEAFMELERGGVDAVINDQAVTLNYIQTSGTQKVVTVGEVFSTEEQYGIGVKKGNEKILNVINEGLEKIKANGEYDKIYAKWIGNK